MWTELFDAVKSVGSPVGLASGGFLIYDRLIRSRPIAYLGTSDYKVDIRLKNIANETIIIDQIKITPDYLQAARANDLITHNEERQKAFYPTMAGKDDPRFEGEFVLLKPLEERKFPLHRFGHFEKAPANEKVVIRCRWENTRRRWFMARYVTVRTTADKVRNLVEVAATGKIT
jgi:hypothetical protein